ncbi:MAG: hypothetical protein DBY38_12225 [Clostridium cadaveris]|uniref:Uncharacterized protein n=1 Tax=Clostridium cadaveris TaxID=1529 RepID=A0A316MI02_9CLOT|nr:MAG: hypothetical protein DBY38_12225 [Clostridium cadaveris]
MSENKGIFFKRFDGNVRKVFFDDKKKYMVLSWIIFKTNYQTEYNGLKRNECYFSYSAVENECNVGRKKLQNILSELENEGFISWVHKSKSKNTTSIIYLIENGYGSENGLKYGLENGKSLENNIIDAYKDTVKDTVKNTVKDTSSRNISKNISNKYNSIFNCWIESNIKNHRALTDSMKKAIDKTLKEYSIDEIQQAIRNYGTMYNDENYQWCDYQWSLNEFILRKDKDGIRQVEMFLNTGSKYLNYLKSKEEINHGTSNMDFC